MALEDLSGRLSELVQTGVAKTKELLDTGVNKTKELTEIGRLKVDNATEQEAIKKAYLEIGKLYFAERGMSPEAPYTALCEKIAASKAKIEYNEERISDLKVASGIGVDADLDTGDESEETLDVEIEVTPDEAAEDEAPAEPAAPEAEEEAETVEDEDSKDTPPEA